jgi:tetratricopeptide (TPR) repeat protein
LSLVCHPVREILPTVPIILLAEKTDSAPPSRGEPSSGRRGAGVPFMEFSTDTIERGKFTLYLINIKMRSLRDCPDGGLSCYSSPSPSDSYKSIYERGFELYSFGQLQDALNLFKQALEIAPSKGERAIFINIIAVIYDELATLYFRQGEKQKTLEYFNQALALIREKGDRSGEGITLNNLGEVYRSLGENAKAREYYQQALAIFQQLGDTKRAETVRNTLTQLNEPLTP